LERGGRLKFSRENGDVYFEKGKRRSVHVFLLGVVAERVGERKFEILGGSFGKVKKEFCLN